VAVDFAPEGADGDPVGFLPPPAKPPFPVWGRVVIGLSGFVALLAWLATALVVEVATAPSGSESENMNGLVILLLPYALTPACILTAVALFVAGACARSATIKGIMFVLGAAAIVGLFVGLVAFHNAVSI
jgi:hypothetical protein